MAGTDRDAPRTAPGAAEAATPEAILAFWFGAPGTPGHGEYRPAWFAPDPAFDAEIRGRFLADWEAAARGERAPWRSEPERCLALVVLTDQFPRNMFRGSARAFATDPIALDAARFAVERGFDRALPKVMRLFLYLPFEHSEVLADQERSVALCRTLDDPEALDYAVRHRDIIARFGRFPHRNAALGRATTEEEARFLTEPGSSF